MFKIFSGSWRGIGGTDNDTLFMQIGLQFRDHLCLFKGAPLAVFLAIALHSNPEGKAWPSIDLIQHETGLSRDTVTRALDYLSSLTIKGQRILLRYRERDPKTKRFIGSNHYIIFPNAEQIQLYTPHSEPKSDFSDCGISDLQPESNFPTSEKSDLKKNHRFNKNQLKTPGEEGVLINDCPDQTLATSTPTTPPSPAPACGVLGDKKNIVSNKVIVEKITPSVTAYIPKSSVDSNGSETHYSPSAVDAETLYRKVRPGHFTVPRSEKFGSAMEILIKYLENYKGDFDAAADALRPFAEEADRRNISQLNLCWLTEWAAAGVMPTHSKKNEFRTFSAQGFRQSLKQVQDNAQSTDKWSETSFSTQVKDIDVDENQEITKYGARGVSYEEGQEISRILRNELGNYAIRNMFLNEVVDLYDLIQAGMSKEEALKLCAEYDMELKRTALDTTEEKGDDWTYRCFKRVCQHFQNQAG